MTEQEVNLYLKEIIQTMNDGMFLTRPDGSLAMVNDALLRMTGYSREELMERPCSVLDCDACVRSRAEGKKHWCRLFNTKRESLKSCHIRRKDGTYVHVIKNASLLVDDSGRELGAVETLTDISELDAKELKIQALSRRLDAEQGFHGLVGESPAMRRVYELLEKASQSEAPVILYGESGTGKELAAAAVHELGPRASGPFVRVNCAALNESLLESEMFGHVKGAFTGAYRHRVGRFEEAAGGDVFLDEIGDVPLPIQVKLLRVLETRTFERVGDNRPLAMDARIITATNQDLQSLVAQNRFRGDFFFRINVIPIHLPPLRERVADIPLLIDHFLRRQAENAGCVQAMLTPDALRACMDYPWPGNVRELKSALEYAQVVSDGRTIEADHLPPAVTGQARVMPLPNSAPPAMDDHAMDNHTMNNHAMAAPRNNGRDSEEKLALVAALRDSGGNQSEAARRLGVSRATVLNRMRKYGIDLRKVITG